MAVRTKDMLVAGSRDGRQAGRQAFGMASKYAGGQVAVRTCGWRAVGIVGRPAGRYWDGWQMGWRTCWWRAVGMVGRPAGRYLGSSANGLVDRCRVSFKISFDSKQPKLEPKLVSALSETKHLFRLFWLFRFYTETESFDVSIEPKQTEDQPKQFDREHILLFFTEKLGFFRVFSVFSFFFRFFRFFSNCFKTVCFSCFASLLKQRVSMFRCFD